MSDATHSAGPAAHRNQQHPLSSAREPQTASGERNMRCAGFVLLCGLGICGLAPAAEPILAPRFELTPAEQSLLSTKLQGATSPRLSVAMSGGGIRSSLFNIGVLKALYDYGLLQKTQVVSSVSGGSYTSYWLYRNEVESPGAAFGEHALSDASFPERVCEIMSATNFVTYGDMAWASKTGYPGLRRMYRNALIRTYGGRDTITKPYSILRLKPLVESGAVPYPIVNASISSGAANKEGWSSRLYEFTPLHYGNRSHGFRSWPDTEPDDYSALSSIAATSGAALRPLDRWAPSPYAEPPEKYYVKLGDGGRTENLGAIAPILRGSRNVIVIDAQLDPRDKPYEAYDRLKAHLAELGLSLRIPGIDADDGSGRAVFPGVVTGPGLESRITYVKMRIPMSLRRAFAAPPAATTAAGNAFDTAFYNAVKHTSAGTGCASVGNIEGSFKSWLFQNTSDYLAWSEGRGFYRKLDRAMPDQQEFPQHSTADQSFYLDQAAAYVGLGYLIGSTGEGREVLAELSREMSAGTQTTGDK